MEPRNLLTDDLQASAPEVRIGLSRVGVTGVHKAIRLSYAGVEKLISAEIECTVDLDPARKGVHMSRFPELFGEATGINACPCAQGLVRGRASERLLEAGYGEDDVERILELVPLATHNQRGRGTLYVGTDLPVNAEQLIGIVERSMSSPVYELLKRPDELFVVEHAHLQPRFVEDSVRFALQETLEHYGDLADGDFLYSRQVNLETIHNHDVIAERHGTVGELRAELDDGEPAARHTELRDWLTG